MYYYTVCCVYNAVFMPYICDVCWVSLACFLFVFCFFYVTCLKFNKMEPNEKHVSIIVAIKYANIMFKERLVGQRTAEVNEEADEVKLSLTGKAASSMTSRQNARDIIILSHVSAQSIMIKSAHHRIF